MTWWHVLLRPTMHQLTWYGAQSRSPSTADDWPTVAYITVDNNRSCFNISVWRRHAGNTAIDTCARYGMCKGARLNPIWFGFPQLQFNVLSVVDDDTVAWYCVVFISDCSMNKKYLPKTKTESAHSYYVWRWRVWDLAPPRSNLENYATTIPRSSFVLGYGVGEPFRGHYDDTTTLQYLRVTMVTLGVAVLRNWTFLCVWHHKAELLHIWHCSSWAHETCVKLPCTKEVDILAVIQSEFNQVCTNLRLWLLFKYTPAVCVCTKTWRGLASKVYVPLFTCLLPIAIT